MQRFLLIGPVTKDTVIRSGSSYRMVGGPIYYQAAVLSALGIETTAIVTIGVDDKNLLESFPGDVEVIPIWCQSSMEFENIYPNNDPNHRLQQAIIPKNPITVDKISGITLREYDAVLVSPLSPYDVPLETLQYIFKKDLPIYLGIQGYLRHLDNSKVVLRPWKDYKKFLSFVSCIFLDEVEAGVVLGNQELILEDIGRKLSVMGPDEVIITLGDRGSLIYSGLTNTTHQMLAVPSNKMADPTGLGDTYLAAYAIKRQISFHQSTPDPVACGNFASEVAAMKLQQKGAFKATESEIKKLKSALFNK